jgi:hypothetical protein
MVASAGIDIVLGAGQLGYHFTYCGDVSFSPSGQDWVPDRIDPLMEH